MTPEKAHDSDTSRDLVSAKLADFARFVTGSNTLVVVDMMGTTPREIVGESPATDQNEE